MWFDEFIKEAKEINQQFDGLKVACDQYENSIRELMGVKIYLIVVRLKLERL